MSAVSAGREELDLADLIGCGAMCSSVLVCNTAVQCPKYKFEGLFSATVVVTEQLSYTQWTPKETLTVPWQTTD